MRIIGGSARGRTIEAPKGMDTRPTLDRVRENLFNILQRRVFDASVLDLFAGSGALALEAISRGAQRAVLCDMDAQAHRIEKANAQKLGFEEKCTFLHCDWKQALTRLQAQHASFDLIFLDPPYRMHDLREVTALCAQVLTDSGCMIVEYERGTPPEVSEKLVLTDGRGYGIAGLNFYGHADSQGS
ncbi:MAG: 16S rRNA (guanine(966)-N(2))-methyltransferase RsmD [Clostridia bacterium]|nr:16S rRNA (guanine(966)-N(2))-methyltransferase RsmD [Clostridia bacterium]MBR1683926.1 16S rRNA (guanine(966)-N(2))-methyltransferase RsmD [Clostridia bacterium]